MCLRSNNRYDLKRNQKREMQGKSPKGGFLSRGGFKAWKRGEVVSLTPGNISKERKKTKSEKKMKEKP